MEFEPALRQELMTIPSLKNRIYPLTAPDASKNNGVPYIIYVSSEGIYEKGLDGYYSSKEVQVEVNIISDSYGEMKSITKDVMALIISFEQRKIGTDGPFIQEVTYQQPRELYEAQPDLYRCLIDFEVYF